MGSGFQTETAPAGQSPRADTPSPLRPEACPVEDWLAFLGHRWNALILWHLRQRPLRHQALMGQLPRITAKVLGERLSALRARGLVQHVRNQDQAETGYYQLTERGHQLLQILDALQWWARA